ncbi:MAG TPA: DUF2220 domain-containing protein [Arachnia sp.]|nr:DUF2220 domain-containing protein [Arachnia sp.]HMT87755.1 DUF2220 domain-containing protein [Arachnia sp.]
MAWGSGYRVDLIGALPFLAGAEVDYWGDLDTHGFAILNRLRHGAPHARSLLMDLETLLAHRDRWGAEPQPTAAALDRLTVEEDELYRALVADRYGLRVRLEQGRIDWRWSSTACPPDRRPAW